MKRVTRIIALLSSASLFLLGSALADPADAQVACGHSLTQSATLTSDIGPCHAGIRIDADGITLDLNGHRIFATDGTQGEGAGIIIRGRRNVTVTNGTVEFFDSGVFIQGGDGNNTISNMTLQHNKTNGASDFGEGITVNAASNNRIVNNTITDNGPFAGISLLKRANNNLIQGNTITENRVPSTNFAGHPTIMQDDGIRIEGPSAKGNQVINNTITNNGLDGVAVFFVAPAVGKPNARNVISGNHIAGNGFNQLNRPGRGIILFTTPGAPIQRTTIQNNTVVNNAANGIEVRSQQNTITNNTATGNGQAGAGFFDLLDTNPNCDQNTWRANTAGTGSPPCTLTP